MKEVNLQLNLKTGKAEKSVDKLNKKLDTTTKELKEAEKSSTGFGEVLGKFKKHMRGDKMVVEDFNNALVAEMGDVMWYYARILDVLGVSFYDVMIGNIQKLHSRMARDVIKGDGDDR